MRSLYALWLFVAVTLSACSEHNPDVCCETPGECARVGFDDTHPCGGDSVCVFNACVYAGCDGSEDCSDPARPLCVANQCEAPAPEPEAPDWVTRHGGDGLDNQPSVAPLANGDLIFSAVFTGTISLGGAPLVSPGTYGTWIARYSTNGTLRWSVVLGDSAAVRGISVAVDGADDVYVVGTFDGSLNLGGGIRSSTRDAFLVKLRGTDGSYVWDTIFDYSAGPQKVVATTADVVVVLCRRSGTVDLGQGPLSSTPLDYPEPVIVGFRAGTGESKWSKSLTSTGEYDEGGAISAIGDDIVVTSGFTGTATLGGDPLVGTGESDVYVARFRGDDGQHIWSRRWGATGEIVPNAIATHGEAVFIGGRVFGTGDLGGVDIQAGNAFEGFVAAYSASDGRYLWDQTFAGLKGSPSVSTLAASSVGLVAGVSLDIDTVTIGDRAFTAPNAAVIIAGLSPATGEPTPSATLFAADAPSEAGSSISTTMALAYSNDRLAGIGTFNSRAALFGTYLTPLGGTDIAAFRVEF